MKQVYVALVALALSAPILAGEGHCQDHGGEGGVKVEKGTEKGGPVNDLCPVMEGNKVDPNLTVEYKGDIIGLCCKTCVRKFKKNPEKYMKKLETGT